MDKKEINNNKSLKSFLATKVILMTALVDAPCIESHQILLSLSGSCSVGIELVKNQESTKQYKNGEWAIGYGRHQGN